MAHPQIALICIDLHFPGGDSATLALLKEVLLSKDFLSLLVSARG